LATATTPISLSHCQAGPGRWWHGWAGPLAWAWSWARISSTVPSVEDLITTWSDSTPVGAVDLVCGGVMQSKPAAATGGSWSAVVIL